ncbi:MAG: HAMP domain-containing sensor histidine kinase, partial [Terrimesophilobacter sp.]
RSGNAVTVKFIPGSESRLQKRIQTWGVRARVTIAASTMLAVILTVGAVALVGLVHSSLLANLDSAAATRAADITSLISTGTFPAILPAQTDDSSLIQVIDSSNSVVSASDNINGEPPILPTPPAVRAVATFDLVSLPVGDPSVPFRIAVHPVTIASGAGWVYIATSLAQVEAATTNLAWLLVAAVPILIALVGVTVFVSAGRSLKPVDNIRRQAESIGSDLRKRVPVPPSHDEVSRLAVTMNQMLDQLEMSAQKQKRFIGDASHELRSPLATLRAQVEISLAEPDTVNASDTLARVELQAIRMSDVIEDLLYLARVDEGGPRESHKQVDLDEVVLNEFRRLETAGQTAVHLVRLDGVRMAGSPRDLARMLRNIGDNAVRHARTGVWFALTSDADNAVITIANDGPPILVADQERIFDRFTRLDEARSRRPGDGGSGLGLSIAQEIAAAHGGNILVASHTVPEDRTSFIVTLPISHSVGSE